MEYKEVVLLVERTMSEAVTDPVNAVKNAIVSYFDRDELRDAEGIPEIDAQTFANEFHFLMKRHKDTQKFQATRDDFNAAWDELVGEDKLWVHSEETEDGGKRNVYSYIARGQNRRALVKAVEDRLATGEIDTATSPVGDVPPPEVENLPDTKGEEEVEVPPSAATGGDPFSAKSEITKNLFVVDKKGNPVEGKRGGKTYRQWRGPDGQVLELCSCTKPVTNEECPEFMQWVADPETGEGAYESIKLGSKEYTICQDTRQKVLDLIGGTLAGWDKKAEEAAKIIALGSKAGAAAKEAGTTTGKINKWMGEMGEVKGVMQLIAEGADAALYTDSEVKNDAVIFTAGEARELKVASVSIKSSYGDKVNALGSSALPDLAHMFEGGAQAPIVIEGVANVNPDHFIASVFQLRNVFLKVLGGNKNGGVTKPAAKGKWQITLELIKNGYYASSAKELLEKDKGVVDATKFKKVRIIGKKEFITLWNSPEFTKNASKKAPVFRDLNTNGVAFSQPLYDACKKAMTPMIGKSLAALDEWIADAAAKAIGDAGVEWTAATDLMMVKADADKGGEMKVQYLTMEAQQKLLAKKSDTPKKIISEVIGLAPKTNISKDWSIRGLQHGIPPEETRTVEADAAVDTRQYLTEIGARPTPEIKEQNIELSYKMLTEMIENMMQ